MKDEEIGGTVWNV